MVIDTSVFIEHLRAKDKTQTTLANLPIGHTLYVSSVTSYELYMGATSPAKQQDVFSLITPLQILVFDNDVAKQAAFIYQNLTKLNLVIDHRDIFIAATALIHNLPIKTLNIKHFNRVQGLIIL